MSAKSPRNPYVYEHGNGLSGFYRGLVRKQLGDGRLKVFVPGVYDDKYEPLENADFLPDAEPASPLFGKSTVQSGMFGVPEIGAVVWLFFANEDANFPVYFATTLNSVPGMGNASWNRIRTEGKYSGELMKNGPAEILMDETSRIRIRCESTEDAVKNHGSLKPAEIDVDRQGATSRVSITADDIVLNCKNFLVKAQNSEIDSAFKLIMRARGSKIDIQSPSIMLNADNGDGTNMISFKSATGAYVI